MIKLTDKDVTAVSVEIRNRLKKDILEENKRYLEEREKEFLSTEAAKLFDSLFEKMDEKNNPFGARIVNSARNTLKHLVLGDEMPPRQEVSNLDNIIRLTALRSDSIDQLFEEATKLAREKTYV